MSLHLSTWIFAVVPLLWVYLLLGRGGFWRVQLRVIPRTLDKRTKIAAIVPARNEADVIGQSISSLLAQQDVDLHVFLVDDNSTDRTADAARHAAAGSDRLTIISGHPLPHGWSGKVWAMQQGVNAAAGTSPDYFLFTDADIEHAPDNLVRLVSIARQDNLDLVSFMVRLHCKTVAEKLLIPAFVFFFFKLYPPKWIGNPSTATAGAAGGCILVRPKALAHAGGLERIRNEIIDDCSLAQEIKHSGGKLWLGLTGSAKSFRPYPSFGAIERMISRTAFNQLKHSSLLLLLSVFGLLLIYIGPIGLVLNRSLISTLCGAVALALMFVSYLPMVRFYRLNPLWGLALPVAAIFYMSATIHSAWNYWFGRGGQWKGRVQDRPAAGVSRAN